MTIVDRELFDGVIKYRHLGIPWVEINDLVNHTNAVSRFQRVCGMHGLEAWDLIPTGHLARVRYPQGTPRQRQVIERVVKGRREGVSWRDLSDILGLGRVQPYFVTVCRQLGLDHRELLDADQ